MKIAYVTTYDATDIKYWSGLGYFIYKDLEKKGLDIQLIGNLRVKNELWEKTKQYFYRLVRKQIYRIERNPAVIRAFGKEIRSRMDPDCDLVFSPASIPIALLATDKPIVFYTDATVDVMRDYYPEFKKYCRQTIYDSERMEQAAIANASAVIYSSNWAAKSAVEHYGAPKDKVAVIPFGANTVCPYSNEEIREIILKRGQTVLKLLFIGVYWERKGGDIALETVRRLNKQGVRAELHLVGKMPRKDWPEFVVNHGFISKSTQQGIDEFNRIISESHFLFLPSRADCTPIVFSEANSFGLPCISTRTGGIPEIVVDGKNGFTLEPDASAEKFATKIAEIFTHRDQYNKLAISAREEYKSRLNWDVSMTKLVEYLENLMAGHH